ncbi:hypothetical protein E3226_000060 [Legionella geestiana]|uniref:hypothetical protein n=1 Tax=Legionella geestiana TaxID=45065 RepID=UPI001091B462|nr:hypothetical protein [Legionella geestiana]QDQ38905.1 hypothetical protein E3226_000060 [Legionella geestiana]
MKHKYERITRVSPSEWSPFNGFSCLDGNDVISGKVSDHHPLIHDGVFFWNMMMQGNMRSNRSGFNNGFGIIESDKDYITRLAIVAQVIAEAIYRCPSIDVISLCEGPVKIEHVKFLFDALTKFSFMTRFIVADTFHQPDNFGQNWGLLMLADARFLVAKVRYAPLEYQPKLANRFQLWKLTQAGKEKFIALGHFPFAGDECKTEKMTLSPSGKEYCHLIHKLMDIHSNSCLIFCADFNFNPYLISQWQDRALDKISNNNSILLSVDSSLHKQVKTVTVDGILLSVREKQEYHSSQPEPGLFRHLKSEYRFFHSHVKHTVKHMIKGEHICENRVHQQSLCKHHHPALTK